MAIGTTNATSGVDKDYVADAIEAAITDAIAGSY